MISGPLLINVLALNSDGGSNMLRHPLGLHWWGQGSGKGVKLLRLPRDAMDHAFGFDPPAFSLRVTGYATP